MPGGGAPAATVALALLGERLEAAPEERERPVRLGAPAAERDLGLEPRDTAKRGLGTATSP